MTDPTAALAAIIVRLTIHMGRRVSFLRTDGTAITGVLSEINLRQEGGGSVWVRFREYPDMVQVTGFSPAPDALPGTWQIEKGHS